MDLKNRDFLKEIDFTRDEFTYLIDLAIDLKSQKKQRREVQRQLFTARFDIRDMLLHFLGVVEHDLGGGLVLNVALESGVTTSDAGVAGSSHDVVGMLRRRFGERQVGHAGTLDPDATGVLLVGVGRCTRLLRFLTDLGKTYTAEIVFGTATDTLDASGTVTATHDMSGLTLGRVRAEVAAHLVGDIMQVPPMVSALKVDGRRLHELAREGIEVRVKDAGTTTARVRATSRCA